MLAMYVHSNRTNWDQVFPYVTYAYVVNANGFPRHVRAHTILFTLWTTTSGIFGRCLILAAFLARR